MSEPKRYDPPDILSGESFMQEVQGGDYVRYEDYARLKTETIKQIETAMPPIEDYIAKLEAENARLKAEVERLKERNQFLEQIDSYLQSANLNAEEQRNIELEAQVERLTKAVMHSPAAQLKLKELEGKTTFDEINPKGGQP